MFGVNDVLVLQHDIPEHNLVKGRLCTVLEYFTKPSPAYEVEFVEEDGRTTVQLTLKPEQVAAYEPAKPVTKVVA